MNPLVTEAVKNSSNTCFALENNAASDLTVKVFRKIEEISPAEWEKVYPNVLEGYYFFKSLDESNLRQFSLYYIMVYRDQVPVGATSCFMMDYSIETTVQGVFRKALMSLKKIFPGALTLRTLMCGQPIGQGQIGFCWNKHKVFEAILSCLEKIAIDEKASIIAFKEFDKTYAELFLDLNKKGYYRFSSVPNTKKAISFKNFDEYLMTLSYATRYDLKRKFKKVDGHVDLKLEISNDLKGSLEEAHALYMQMIHQHEMGFETMPKEFFKKIAENMPEKTKFFLWRMDKKLVAFAFCLVSEDYFLDYYLGLDYSVAYDCHLYFVRFRDMMKWCIDHKMKVYEMGCTNYDPKKRLDFQFVPLDIYAKFRDKRFNSLSKYVCELIKPENFDPVLKEVYKKNKKQDSKKVKQKRRKLFFVIPLILINEGVDAVAQVLMKKGLPVFDSISINFHTAVQFLNRSVSSYLLWTGIFVYALNFFVWIFVLAKIDVSVAVPLTSLNYIVIPLLTVVFLHEKVRFVRWIGIVSIVFGVCLLSKNTVFSKAE